MTIIERYIAAVSELLPEDMKKDVANELKSNIEDMLPDDPSEDDIEQVLIKLGNPKLLAQEYNPKKRYLIGPSVYESYVSVLKLVIGIATPLFLLFAALGIFTDNPADITYSSIISGLISTVIEGCMQSVFWVTLVFMIIERSGANEGKELFKKKQWSPEDLFIEPVPPKSMISRVKVIVSMFFTVFFTTLLYINPNLIAMYQTTDGKIDIYSLFDADRMNHYLAAVLIVVIFHLLVSTWMLIKARWTVSLAVANAVRNIAAGLLVVFIFNDSNLINIQFLGKIAEIADISVTKINEIWFSATKVITLCVFIIVYIFDSISAFIKCKKQQ
ncbi:MAG: hypothetical protein AB9835_08545 [Eubacteriales bacterium]